MATKPICNADVINAVRMSMPGAWGARIPVASATNYKDVGLALTSSEYTPEMNAFITTMFNKIGLTVFARNDLSNPLAFLKNGSFSMGDTVEEIALDVIKGKQYDMGEPDQFAKEKNEPKVMFHKRNRKMFYKTTIQDAIMREAFQKENGLYELINLIIFQLYNSNVLDEYIYTKEMFTEYRKGTKPTGVVLQPTQEVSTSYPIDEATGKEFYKTVKLAVNNILYPSKLYNASELTVQNRPENLCCYMLGGLNATLDVDVLAKAFHTNKLDINVPIVALDDFGSDNDDVLAVIADRETFRVLQNNLEMTQSYNAEGLYRNIFLHVWQTYMASYFRNIIFITKK